MKLIERYVYACIRHLPKNIRDDVSQELTSEIETMIDEHKVNGTNEREAIQMTLESLGDPKQLASQYIDKPTYLIGPLYYPTFIMVSKIVLLAVTIGLTVAFFVRTFLQTQPIGYSIVGEYLASIFSGGVQSIAWVVFIFVLLERADDASFKKEITANSWSVDQLPELPALKKSLRSEGIVGLIFTLIFFILLNTRLEWFSAFIISNGTQSTSIPMFNLASKNDWLLLFNVSLLFSVVVHFWYIIKPYPTPKQFFSLVTLELISLVIIVIAFQIYSPLNPELFIQLTPTNQTLIDLWGQVVGNAGWYIGFFGLLGITLDSISYIKNKR